MRISTKGRYSLEALLYLALKEQDGEAECFASTREIACATGYSEGYLEQLFIPLRKAGLLKGARGPLGGYSLGKKAASISAGDVLRAAEGGLKPTGCAGGADLGVCPESYSCESRVTWDALYQCITDTVDSISLASLVDSYKSAYSGAEYCI